VKNSTVGVFGCAGVCVRLLCVNFCVRRSRFRVSFMVQEPELFVSVQRSELSKIMAYNSGGHANGHSHARMDIDGMNRAGIYFDDGDDDDDDDENENGHPHVGIAPKALATNGYVNINASNTSNNSNNNNDNNAKSNHHVGYVASLQQHREHRYDPSFHQQTSMFLQAHQKLYHGHGAESNSPNLDENVHHGLRKPDPLERSAWDVRAVKTRPSIPTERSLESTLKSPGGSGSVNSGTSGSTDRSGERSGSRTSGERSPRGLLSTESAFLATIDDEDDEESVCFNVWNEDFSRNEPIVDHGVVNAQANSESDHNTGIQVIKPYFSDEEDNTSQEETILDAKPSRQQQDSTNIQQQRRGSKVSVDGDAKQSRRGSRASNHGDSPVTLNTHVSTANNNEQKRRGSRASSRASNAGDSPVLFQISDTPSPNPRSRSGSDANSPSSKHRASITPPLIGPIMSTLDALHMPNFMKTVTDTLSGIHVPHILHTDTHPSGNNDTASVTPPPAPPVHATSPPQRSKLSIDISSPAQLFSSLAGYSQPNGNVIPPAPSTPSAGLGRAVFDESHHSPGKRNLLKKMRSDRVGFADPGDTPVTPTLKMHDIYVTVLNHGLGLGLLLTEPHPGNMSKSRGRFIVKGFRKNMTVAGPQGSSPVDSPCAEAGIRVGDAIDSIDDVRIRDVNDIGMCLQAHKRSEKRQIKITVVR
jgi:hypothetical protein